MCEKLNRLKKERETAYAEVNVLESYLRELVSGRETLPEGKSTLPVMEEIDNINATIRRIDDEILKLL